MEITLDTSEAETFFSQDIFYCVYCKAELKPEVILKEGKVECWNCYAEYIIIASYYTWKLLGGIFHEEN